MNIIKFTKKGQFHRLNKMKNEDVIRCKENDRFSIIALADGASSCKNSKTGATVICREIVEFLSKNALVFYKYSGTKTAYLILEQLLYRLKLIAVKQNEDLYSYAATLVFCCIDKVANKLLLFNLGDGAVFEYLGDEHKAVKPILPPKRIEKKYTPLVTSDNAYRVADVKIIDAKPNQSILICSDGTLKEFNSAIDENVELDVENNCENLSRKINASNNFDDCSFVLIKT
ncbi:MAG: protein phosphatase 2C domain-containing protein [Eubacterium sp.]